MKIIETENKLTLFVMKPLPTWLLVSLIALLSPAILLGMTYMSYGEISMAIFGNKPVFVIIELVFLTLVPPPTLFIISLFLRWERLIFNKKSQLMTYERGFLFFKQEKRTLIRDVLSVYTSRLERYKTETDTKGQGHWILNVILSQQEHGISEPRALPFPDSQYIYKERENHVRYLALKLGKFLNVPVKTLDIDKLSNAVRAKSNKATPKTATEIAKPRSLGWAWTVLASFSIGVLAGYGSYDIIQTQFETQAFNLLNQSKHNDKNASQMEQELDGLGIDPEMLKKIGGVTKAKPSTAQQQQTLRDDVTTSVATIKQLNTPAPQTAEQDTLDEVLDGLDTKKFEPVKKYDNPIEAANALKDKRQRANDALNDLDNM